MRKYTMDDLPELMEKNPYMIDIAKDMIQLAVMNGNYQDVEINDDFIHRYLLEEINDYFIAVNVDIN